MNKKALFEQLVPFISAVHQTQNDMTKQMPIGELTKAQYGILEYIAVSQPITLSEISDCKDMSMPNTSRELKKLTDKGLCVKISDAEDRRKQYIRLSPEGEALMGMAFGYMEDQLAKKLEGVTDETLEQMIQAMALLQRTIFQAEQ
ncbi:MarR family winged helix-turn-helix transcriptional regulator [Paenibacillus sp. NEAU-GSW1]|uniref:MarR family winged helix-turn-helix transcriptional regulator n=1 Tax=Paenibacillus sp. NEAU-GSW1 TaxID=2682486 RepID=UPI0012E1E0CC|nr:MarR family transcriptional regulator [Paenibacillus sp. NEAU-GSW1]MUT64603.1 MarR family transcriptional regulator [Paenibacillus sp. NEAU-GSW1]